MTWASSVSFSSGSFITTADVSFGWSWHSSFKAVKDDLNAPSFTCCYWSSAIRCCSPDQVGHSMRRGQRGTCFSGRISREGVEEDCGPQLNWEQMSRECEVLPKPGRRQCEVPSPAAGESGCGQKTTWQLTIWCDMRPYHRCSSWSLITINSTGKFLNYVYVFPFPV